DLDVLHNEVTEYVDVINKFARELEDLSWSALTFPGGYYMGLELFGYSQCVLGAAHRVGGIASGLGEVRYQYEKAVDEGVKSQQEVGPVEAHWDAILKQVTKPAAP